MAEKALIVYYSRSGNAEKLAKKLNEKFKYDMDKLEYAEKERVSFIAAVMESLQKASLPIKGDNHSPDSYERIIFVSPIWKSSLPTPIRSYMLKYKPQIKSYILLAVSGKVGFEGVLKDAAKIFGREPYASAHYSSAQITKGAYTIDSLAL